MSTVLLIAAVWIAVAVLLSIAYCLGACIGENKAYERYVAEGDEKGSHG